MESRRYPKHPIPGVGAIVTGPKGILLVRRDKDPGKGLWSIPGGGVEIGETVEEAVVREVLEETGVHINPLGTIGHADVIMKNDEGKVEYHFILIHFIAEALTHKTRQESPEAEVRWFKMDALPVDEMPTQIKELILKNIKGTEEQRN